MISKATIKFIKSLQIKKYRKQEQCFVVEGAKSVLELLQSDFETTLIVGTDEFINQLNNPRAHVIPATEKELQGLGEFQTNTGALAVARMKANERPVVSGNEIGLVLDDIRDPGNLGTIVRIADWYRINAIIASEETADFYNSKVITSSMGSFTRLHVYYADLSEYLRSRDVSKITTWGAFLDGQDVHDCDFSSGGLVVIGNESRGISPEIEKLITRRITIPRYGKAESLNAAIATGIICDNIRRKH